ncbi:uncharacterized protein Z519_07381 [Cladophialophora bantiana CBS 173.52]|uniref:Uncharacterized protein n=1 Tax=Cladophialophora bantiana (strain ATCC 10958 / CBS 173.52 / CDC B-1940 / NIH 8579) TaxID=1442370 RepID=A0A0D2G0X9_CLAB1|nr:uncharacterized protein Z519_07381 [Cladophialophora bantiana CBS 173.52]KIW92397.1 hypothetical protein Z519_07381 [Cladophialophora bantiana CBS 173.52]
MALARGSCAKSDLDKLGLAELDPEKVGLGGTDPAAEEQYHLEFATNRYRPAAYAGRVDEFLAELFHPAPTPLVLDHHLAVTSGGPIRPVRAWNLD